MNDLISVILPVYNGGLHLEEAIESILNQSYINFELIIINDGSKDDSLITIQKYAMSDSRIKVITRENKGLIASLNEGIEKSLGSYIARMDQDDISLPRRLEEQCSYMLKGNLDICGGDFITIDKNNNFLRKNKVPKTDAEILITMVTNVPFAHPSVLIKKSFLIKNNLKYGLNGYRNGEDLDLWMLMYQNGAKFGNLHNVVLKYRVLDTSLSRINHKKIKQESEEQFNDFLNKNKTKFELAFKTLLKQKTISNEMQKNMMRSVLRYTFLVKNPTLFFFAISKVEIKNAMIGIASFMKLKFF